MVVTEVLIRLPQLQRAGRIIAAGRGAFFRNARCNDDRARVELEHHMAFKPDGVAGILAGGEDNGAAASIARLMTGESMITPSPLAPYWRTFNWKVPECSLARRPSRWVEQTGRPAAVRMQGLQMFGEESLCESWMILLEWTPPGRFGQVLTSKSRNDYRMSTVRVSAQWLVPAIKICQFDLVHELRKGYLSA